MMFMSRRRQQILWKMRFSYIHQRSQMKMKRLWLDLSVLHHKKLEGWARKGMQQPYKIAYQLLTKVLQKQEENKNDECSTYGQLVASVLQKFPELEGAKTMALLNEVLRKQHVAYLESEQYTVGMNVAGPSSS